MGDPVLERILRNRGAVPASQAANRIQAILAARLSQAVKVRQCQQQLQPPQGSTEKAWLRAVETSYNHSKKWYTIVSFEGKPYEVAHVEPYSRNFGQELRLGLPSPFRQDLLRHLLPQEGKQIVDRLERATRFRKLTTQEAAKAVLSKEQRNIAVKRAKDYRLPLAQWLFDDKNWTYIVTTSAKWNPKEDGGFFETPTLIELLDWPKDTNDTRQGDKLYLQKTASNFTRLKETILGYKAEILKTAAAAGITSPEARQILQGAFVQRIVQIRQKLHLLRQNTQKQEILTDKLLKIEVIWKKDLPNDLREWRRQGLLDPGK
jgi:hypothetical protein